MSLELTLLEQLTDKLFSGANRAESPLPDVRPLDAEQYALIADLLEELQRATARKGNTPLAAILQAASQLNLTCSHYQLEAKSHWQAYQDAVKREHELRQQLQAILSLISQEETAETQKLQAVLAILAVTSVAPSKTSPQPAAATSLGVLQRLQNFLRLALDSYRSHSNEPAVLTPAALPPPKEEQNVPDDSPALAVYCLGPLRVYQNDRLLTEWTGLKGQLILKRLIANPHKPIAKDILMDLFWPDADPESARRNLHQAIYSLRQALKIEQSDFQHILFENDAYFLNPRIHLWLDYEEFKQHAQAGRRLEAEGQLSAAITAYGIAEGLYLGDFLEEDLYEEWATLVREQLRNTYLDINDRLSEYYIQQGEYAAAIALCQKALEKDNCHEAAYRRLMRCYIYQNQRHLAVRQYQLCQEVLRAEIDLAPSAETVALYRQIVG